jgi:hypothetical protein
MMRTTITVMKLMTNDSGGSGGGDDNARFVIN